MQVSVERIRVILTVPEAKHIHRLLAHGIDTLDEDEQVPPGAEALFQALTEALGIEPEPEDPPPAPDPEPDAVEASPRPSRRRPAGGRRAPDSRPLAREE